MSVGTLRSHVLYLSAMHGPGQNGAQAPLPMTTAEIRERGWSEVDVVFVTGDAYVDHPSFAMALLGRVLQSHGYRVAILSQPDWRSAEPWRTFGRPRLCFAVSAGNMDSMINHYTAGKKVRNDDAYSPGGRPRLRPDRATLAYCQRAKEAYDGVPVIAGGVEASLRRFTHYDYWSDKVRRAIICDAKADLVVYGMGEVPLLEIVRLLDAGQGVSACRRLRSVVYRLTASEAAAFHDPSYVVLPSYEEAAVDPAAFARMTALIHRHTNPYNAQGLLQLHGDQAVVANPPSYPLDEAAMDRVYDLPYTRKPHPSYGDQTIPAYTVIKTSVQIMRGCFGGCTFCSITMHEGRVIQSRSERSILDEIKRMTEDPTFKGVISDIGGPTANMYRMNCSVPEVRAVCRRLSCIHPKVCKLLATDHGPLLGLMRAARTTPGIKKALVASGIRMDLANRSPEYIKELTQHHTGGLLKVAPEHVDSNVLNLMKKPPVDGFEQFTRSFQQASQACGKRQGIVPYFIAGHPGSDLPAMISLALFLKRTNNRPDKVQDFIPSPMDIATCMYHTGLDPMTGKPVYVAKGARERRLQRALLQYWKPENHGAVVEALTIAGRRDLIGAGPHCLVASLPPAVGRAAREANPVATAGYRPGRQGARGHARRRGAAS